MTEHNWQKNFSVNLCEAFPWATPELQWVTWFKFLTFCNNFLFSKALIPEKGLVTWLILACEQAHPRTHAPGNGIPCLRLKTLKHISAHIRSVHIWRIAPRGKCNELQFSLGSGSIVRERNSAKKSLKTYSLSANEPTTVPNTIDEPKPTTNSWFICLDVIP